MIKRSLFVFILLTLVQFGQAQTADRRIAFGISGEKTLYVGDYGGNGIYDFGRSEILILGIQGFPTGYWSGGFSFNTYLSSSFDLGIQGFYGEYGYFISGTENFLAMKFETSLFAHYKFNNGYILAQNAKLSPFLSVGFGMASYGRDSWKDYGKGPRGNFSGIDFIVPLGAGFKYQITNKFAFQYQYLYNFTNSDIHDQHSGASIESSKPGNDAWGEHIFSVIYSIRTPFFDKIVPKKSSFDNKANSWKPTVVRKKPQYEDNSNRWKSQYEYNADGWKSHGYKKK